MEIQYNTNSFKKDLKNENDAGSKTYDTNNKFK
jgi:hypothetical protein